MFPLFNVLLAPLIPGLGLYTLHRRFFQKKSAESFAGQWGRITPSMRAFGRQRGPKIWLHAVSVGETVAARPIARALKAAIPEARIALSSTTDTGHDIAKKMLALGEVDLVFYFPLDLAPVQSRDLSALRPDALCFVETELWPNLLHLARKRGIPTFLVNGRVSDNLLKTAPKLGPLWRWMQGNVSLFLMRGEEDAARLLTLGVPESKISVTGDVKLEIPPVESSAMRQGWRNRVGLKNELVLVAGSTHAGEEELLLRAWQRLRGEFPTLRLALAPRHVERAPEVAQLVEKQGLRVVRRSQNQPWGEGAIYLLDTVGELADFYALGDVAFVGGSMIPRGGHNMLEPVLRGVPVVCGPHVMNFRAAATLVQSHSLGSQAKDEDELDKVLHFWLQAANRNAFPARVETALAPHRGAAARLAQSVAANLRRN